MAAPPGYSRVAIAERVLSVVRACANMWSRKSQRDLLKGEALDSILLMAGEQHIDILYKHNEPLDVSLVRNADEIVHVGRMLYQLEPAKGSRNPRVTEVFIILFNNCLIITEPLEHQGGLKYLLLNRPYPIDLLMVRGSGQPPSIIDLLHGSTCSGFPIILQRFGRSNDSYILYAEDEKDRKEWITLLQAMHERRQDNVFEFRPVDITGVAESSFIAQAMDKIQCVAQFSTDGQTFLAIGCNNGLWIGAKDDASSFNRVHVGLFTDVTQCAVIESLKSVLILADQCLYECSCDDIVSRQPLKAFRASAPQRLSSAKRGVQFFAIGTIGGRTLVTYAMRKGIDTVFRILEPVSEILERKHHTMERIYARFGLGQQHRQFRIYRDFYIPSEVTNIIFLKSKLALACPGAYEIMDISDFKSFTIPPRDQNKARNVSKLRALNLLRVDHNDFLLCYDEGGLSVNRHGDPHDDAGAYVQWEATMDSAISRGAHLLLFNSSFVEIREARTGKLLQVIRGEDVRCLSRGWSIEGGAAASSNLCTDEDGAGSRRPVFFTMQTRTPEGAMLQRIYELQLIETTSMANPVEVGI